MEWNVLTKLDAKNRLDKWGPHDYKEFEKYCLDRDLPSGGLNDTYRDIRSRLKEAFDKAERIGKSEDPVRKDYLRDLYFARDLYTILEDYGMNVRIASNDRVWAYLTVCVVPEIIFRRYGLSEYAKTGLLSLKHERYYKSSRRIYLKTLWWYIYLSLQKDPNGNYDMNKTFSLLYNNNTDTIVQLVERAGSKGYRVDLTRAIMKFYGEHSSTHTTDDFRRVLVLNTARSQIIEPVFSKNGIDGYVKELFDSLAE